MSYPGDGLPRFKVGELEWARSRAERKEAVRNRAIGLAAMLEAEHAVG